MYSEIHRHLVLCKKLPNSTQSRFRQIVVVEREQFEVRVLESDVVQLDLRFTDDVAGADVKFHTSLSSAVLNAEDEYKQSVRSGWRAYNPETHQYSPKRIAHRGPAAA